MWADVICVPGWFLALLAVGAIGSEVIHQLVRLRSGRNPSQSDSSGSK